MRARLKVWIEAEDGRVALSDWRIALLEAIDTSGSLVAAARSLGVPHRTAWQRIREMEDCLNVRLVDTTTGGAGGGHSRLSPTGRELVRRYHVMRAGVDELVLERYQSMFVDLMV